MGDRFDELMFDYHRCAFDLENLKATREILAASRKKELVSKLDRNIGEMEVHLARMSDRIDELD